MSRSLSHQPSVKKGSSPRVRARENVSSTFGRYPAPMEITTVHSRGHFSSAR